MPKIYFCHSSLMHNELCMVELLNDYGLEGYGLYCIILEIARNQKNYKIEASEKIIKYITTRIPNISEDKVKRFIRDCIKKYKLLEIENKFIYSKSILDDMQVMKNNIKKTSFENKKENKKENKVKKIDSEIKASTDVKEIFNIWNSTDGVKHHKNINSFVSLIQKNIKEYGKETVKDAISNLSVAVMNKKYFYNVVWSLEKFLKQSNGISNWTNEGDLFLSYKKNQETLEEKDIVKKLFKGGEM